jgi:hypothetical protein
MNSERDFDQIARAWLELGPDEAPERTVAAVLRAIETAPQVRKPIRWPLERGFHMQRLPLIAVMAALVGAVIGGALLFSGGGRNGLAPVPSPTATVPSTAPSAVVAEIPAALQYRWIGQPRDIPGVSTTTRTALNFMRSAFGMSGTSWGFASTSMFPSEAALAAPGTIQVWTASPGLAGGCEPGQLGTYAYTLSPGGTQLHVAAVGTDGCAARQVAVVGDWNRVACTNVDSGCWGTLEAGTHQTQYIDPKLDAGEVWAPRLGAIEFTVPDGWANSVDWPNWFALTPQADYATETPEGPATESAIHEVSLFALPAAAVGGRTCNSAAQPAVPRTVDGLIEYVQGITDLVTSDTPTPVTIDGHPGKWINLAVASTDGSICPGESEPGALYLVPADDSDMWHVGIIKGERQRLLLLDLGDGDILAVVIDSADPDRFNELVDQAMPIIESMTFH